MPEPINENTPERIEDDSPIVNLRSEPVQEIIGRDPLWIIRWGITVVTIIVLMLLVSTYIVKYPEIISTRVSITTLTPPVRVISRSSGKIVSFFVQEADQVNTDQYLAVMENTADYNQIVDLRERLNSFRDFLTQPEKYLENEWPKDVLLGDLQVPYSDFIRAFSDYQSLEIEDYNGEKIRAIENQIAHYRTVNQTLGKQRDLMKQDLDVYQETFDRNKSLYEQGLLPETEFNTYKGRLLEKKSSMENARNSLTNNSIRIEELKRSILELEQDVKDRRRQLQLNAQESYKQLLSQFNIWEQRYILKAPTEGRVSFFQFWSENQYVNAGEEVMMIIPELNEYVGRITVPQFGVGKIEIDQEVNMKFDSFPFKEFGMVKGQVASISRVARENQYLIIVKLTNGLNTTYRKELNFKHNMEGSADIITRDLRLIERIFNQFRYIFSNNV